MSLLDTLNYRLFFRTPEHNRKFVMETIAHLNPCWTTDGLSWRVDKTDNDAAALALANWAMPVSADPGRWAAPEAAHTLNDVRDAGLAVKRKHGVWGRELMDVLTPALGYRVPALTEVKMQDYGKVIKAFEEYDRRLSATPDDAAAPSVYATFEAGGPGDVGLREGEVAARLTAAHPALGAPYGEDPYARVARELYSPQTAPDILQRAAQHMQDRAAARDQAGGERSMRRTVDAFNALTGHNVSERDGWLFMAVLKMARATTTPAGTPDDYEDLAAYAALAGESAQEKKA